MIINGRKLTESDIQETTIIELLAKGMDRSEEEVLDTLTSLSNTLEKLSRPRLYRQEIDMNAIDWIKGLCSPSALSFVHISDKGDVKYSTKRITRLGYHDTPIKILDATGDASASSALVGRTLENSKSGCGLEQQSGSHQNQHQPKDHAFFERIRSQKASFRNALLHSSATDHGHHLHAP